MQLRLKVVLTVFVEMTTCQEIDYMCHLDGETFEKVQRYLGEDEEKRRQLTQAVRDWLKQQVHLNARTGCIFFKNYL